MLVNQCLFMLGLLPLLSYAAPAPAPVAGEAALALLPRQGPTPTSAAPSSTVSASVLPTCLMGTNLPAWQYGIVLDAHAPGVNTDCGNDYLYSMQQRGMDISSWWCYPFAANNNSVALADPSCTYVVLTFWTVADSNTEIQGAIWDASQHQYTTVCTEYDGNVDKPDEPEVEAGESEPEDPEPEK